MVSVFLSRESLNADGADGADGAISWLMDDQKLSLGWKTTAFIHLVSVHIP